MAKAPAVVIIARHGARLDVADKTWHLTSPTPYDPPLTYGGWNQSKALGSRIASLLQARAELGSSVTDGKADRRDWKRRYDVVIHSSPFLRCIQTSIAIGAGMSEQHEAEGRRTRRRSKGQGGRRRSKTTIEEEDEERSSEDHHESSLNARAAVRDALKDGDSIYKVSLRIDAFLGEWLTPDYYEDITPPPGSTMMVAGAKAELLRKEPIDVFQPDPTGKGYFPGGWNRPSSAGDPGPPRAPSPIIDDHALAMTSTAQTIPRVQRSSSHSSVGSTSSRKTIKGYKDVYSSLSASRSGYLPPIPAYAISPMQPIPRGYVAHAQEACVDVDFQWDSMRAPQNWGDGGEYGEEWSSMHKRFRFGLYRLVTWYKEHQVHQSYDEEDTAVSSSSLPGADDDRELVVILVTHGAGCNALIGGLTNQPVLMDVGMASLTMAVRREESDTGQNTLPISPNTDLPQSPQSRSLFSFGLSNEYEMKLTASSDHLRAGSDATRIAALQSPSLVPRIPEYRRRGQPNIGSPKASSPSNGSLQESTRPFNSALGSIRRSSTLSGLSFPRYESSNPSRSPSSSGGASSSGSGLWSKNPETPSSLEGAAEYTAGQIEELSLGPALKDSPVVQAPLQAAQPTKPTLAPLRTSMPARSVTHQGLWTPSPTSQRNVRDSGTKRRWTVTDHEG